uniref:Reverse transcriptase zinc-binding domain-containing protein n=1 Tax=Glossina palpalis gambiensis TaxID=67801 RepID=A0A1B0AQ30_9MUSC
MPRGSVGFRELINDDEEWVRRHHGSLDYFLTKILSAHGCFGHDADRDCQYCRGTKETTKHALLECSRFNHEERTVENLVEQIALKSFWLRHDRCLSTELNAVFHEMVFLALPAQKKAYETIFSQYEASSDLKHTKFPQYLHRSADLINSNYKTSFARFLKYFYLKKRSFEGVIGGLLEVDLKKRTLYGIFGLSRASEFLY